MPETDPDTVLANYDAVHLGCRVDRHQWSRQATWAPHDEFHNKRIRICELCGTRSIWVINITTYEVVRRYYQPAKGYSARGTGLRLDDFRVRLLSQEIHAEEKRAKRRTRRAGTIHVA